MLAVCCCTEFVVTPGRSWMLQTGRIYHIHVEIFDKESRKIYPSEVCYVLHWTSCVAKHFCHRINYFYL